MEIEELKRFFDEFPRKIAQTSELALTRTAEKIQVDLSTIFKTEGKSHGVDWKDLNPRYLAYKVKKGFSEKKLHRTTTLAQSFTYKVQDWRAVIGTPVPYAVYHETGTRRGIPPRPYMQPAVKKFLEDNHFKKISERSLKEVL
jgi:phage gpG-like protein